MEPTPRRRTRGTKTKGVPVGGWNGFVDTWEKVRQMQPKMDRLLDGGAAVIPILIIATVAPATYASGVLTPTDVTVYPWYPDGGAEGTRTWDEDTSMDGRSYYLTEITVTAAKGRFGYLVDGELLIVDCTEFTL